MEAWRASVNIMNRRPSYKSNLTRKTADEEVVAELLQMEKENALENAVNMDFLDSLLAKELNDEISDPSSAEDNNDDEILQHGLEAEDSTQDWKSTGLSELHKAVELGLVDKVESMLSQRLPREGKDDITSREEDTASQVHPWTPLHLAAAGNHHKIAKLLLEANFKVDALTKKKGWTPLHYAVHNGHASLVALLIDAGANVNAETFDGKLTPLMLLVDFRNHKMIMEDCPEKFEMLASSEAIRRRLLEEHADVHCVDDKGHNLLHQNKCSIDVEHLVQCGVDINATDGHGNIPLILALHHKNIPDQEKLIRVLLECGADPDYGQSEGRETPREMAQDDPTMRTILGEFSSAHVAAGDMDRENIIVNTAVTNFHAETEKIKNESNDGGGRGCCGGGDRGNDCVLQ